MSEVRVKFEPVDGAEDINIAFWLSQGFMEATLWGELPDDYQRGFNGLAKRAASERDSLQAKLAEVEAENAALMEIAELIMEIRSDDDREYLETQALLTKLDSKLEALDSHRSAHKRGEM